MSRSMEMTLSGERALITALRRKTRKFDPRGVVRVGIGDDCAVLQPPAGHELVVTTDLFLEMVHFRRDWHTPEAAGHRCLARGLSDLAAMGADPLAAFLSVAIPAELASRPGRGRSWVDRFVDGLLALAKLARVPLAGGDTAQSPSFPCSVDRRNHGMAGATAFFSADILLLGSVPAGEALLRSGSGAGDTIYVTGTLGGAAAELALLGRNQPRRLRGLRHPEPGKPHPHLFPEPRLAAGRRLRRLATAAIDLSDGIATDLDHLCRASGLCAVLDTDRIPVHPLALKTNESLAFALTGGEDYELLFTAPAEVRIPRRIGLVPIRPIGHMRTPQRGEAPHIVMRSGEREQRLDVEGWQHFESTPKT
jgi:thiamine-monophosphate kinase